MMLDKTNYEDDKMDQQKEEEERLLIVMVTINAQQLNSPYNINAKSGVEVMRKKGIITNLNCDDLGMPLTSPSCYFKNCVKTGNENLTTDEVSLPCRLTLAGHPFKAGQLQQARVTLA